MEVSGPPAWTYLSGRIHRGSSVQQFLDQVQVALLGCQMESIETVLGEEHREPSEHAPCWLMGAEPRRTSRNQAKDLGGGGLPGPSWGLPGCRC